MPVSFPAVVEGKMKVRYPLTRNLKYRTTVLCSTDTSEQRFSKASPVQNFQLTFTSVNTADKNSIETFFNDQKGSTNTTWELTLPDPSPTTWINLQFTPGQRFQATENKPGYWSFAVSFRQTNPNPTT